MSESSNLTARLVALIQAQGRWPTIARPLDEALEASAWRVEGFPSPTAWLDRLAALGGRSTTYLSRCVSAARFLREMGLHFQDVDFAAAWSRPLSAIEGFRRQTGNDLHQIHQRLGELASGSLPAHIARQDLSGQARTTAKAKRMWLEHMVLQKLPRLLPRMGYSPDTQVLVEPRTPLGRPDIVLIDPTSGATTIIEVKSDLSRRRQDDIVQQLLAYSSLSTKVWLVLPASSEVPGHAILDSLKQAAVHHVGVLRMDPATADAVEILAPDGEAPENESRAAFKGLVLASHRVET